MIYINGIRWDIQNVGMSHHLMRSDGSYTIGMTDGITHTIYLYYKLRGALKDKVLAHELVHAFMFSYDIHIDIELEEYIADWVSIYGRDLIYLLDDIMSNIKETRQKE